MENKEVYINKNDVASLISNIKAWGIRKGIDKQGVNMQTVKLMEEVGELAEAVCKNREEQLKDSIGDVTVVLIMLCLIKKYQFEDCLKLAYETIKNRKGKIINGNFVKESDYGK